MKRAFFIGLGFLMFCIAKINACDACGSSANNMGIGLMTDYRSNFISLRYYSSPFKSRPEHEYLVSDNFVQMNLSMRCAIGQSKRIKLTANLPYSINMRKSIQDSSKVQGLSDVSIYASYSVFNNIAIGEKSMFYLELGGGLNLPTGEYDDQIHDRNLPENFNVGKGSLGYIIQMNTVLSSGKNGIVFSNNYQLNSETKSGYRYGNQLNSQMTVFREIEAKKFKLIPSAGIGFESTSKDNYANGNNVSETGGKGLFLTSAFNFNTKKWLAGISYSIPISNDYSQGDVIAKGRIAGQISFIF